MLYSVLDILEIRWLHKPVISDRFSPWPKNYGGFFFISGMDVVEDLCHFTFSWVFFYHVPQNFKLVHRANKAWQDPRHFDKLCVQYLMCTWVAWRIINRTGQCVYSSHFSLGPITGEAYIRSCSHGLTTGLIRLWLYPQWQSAGNSPGGRGISALAVVRNRFDINRSDNVSFYWTRTQGCGLIINATQLNNWLIVNAIALTFAPNVLGKHWIPPIKPSIRMRQMRISMRVIYIYYISMNCLNVCKIIILWVQGSIEDDRL